MRSVAHLQPCPRFVACRVLDFRGARVVVFGTPLPNLTGDNRLPSIRHLHVLLMVDVNLLAAARADLVQGEEPLLIGAHETRRCPGEARAADVRTLVHGLRLLPYLRQEVHGPRMSRRELMRQSHLGLGFFALMVSAMSRASVREPVLSAMLRRDRLAWAET